MVDADPGFGRVAFIDTRGRNAMRRVVMSAAAAVTVGATAVVSAPAALAEEPSGVSRVSVAYDGEPAGDSSHYPVVSGDGRVVAFGSNAANIVRQDFNGVFDTFVRDLSTGVSTRVSVASDGTAADAASYGAALSYDGGLWPSIPGPGIWSRVTPTVPPTCSSTTGRPASRAG
jgi:hypothetical protein